MPDIKERFQNWKESRSTGQKAGDIFFWVLLLLLIIPGPRKAIATTVNRVAMHMKGPGLVPEDRQVTLADSSWEWQLATEQGVRLSLSEFRGKPVLLNFWATWCPPCVAELPSIEKSWEKHGDEVAFLLVTNQEPTVVKAFMEKHDYSFPVHYSTASAPPELAHSSIPTTYLLSPEGKIIIQKKGALNWNSRAIDKVYKDLLR